MQLRELPVSLAECWSGADERRLASLFADGAEFIRIDRGRRILESGTSPSDAWMRSADPLLYFALAPAVRPPFSGAVALDFALIGLGAAAAPHRRPPCLTITCAARCVPEEGAWRFSRLEMRWPEDGQSRRR